MAWSCWPIRNNQDSCGLVLLASPGQPGFLWPGPVGQSGTTRVPVAWSCWPNRNNQDSCGLVLFANPEQPGFMWPGLFASPGQPGFLWPASVGQPGTTRIPVAWSCWPIRNNQNNQNSCSLILFANPEQQKFL